MSTPVVPVITPVVKEVGMEEEMKQPEKENSTVDNSSPPLTAQSQSQSQATPPQSQPSSPQLTQQQSPQRVEEKVKDPPVAKERPKEKELRERDRDPGHHAARERTRSHEDRKKAEKGEAKESPLLVTRDHPSKEHYHTHHSSKDKDRIEKEKLLDKEKDHRTTKDKDGAIIGTPPTRNTTLADSPPSQTSSPQQPLPSQQQQQQPPSIQPAPPNLGDGPQTWHDRLPLHVQEKLKQIELFLDSNTFTIIIVLLTLLALFLDDIRRWAAPPRYDVGFFSVILIVFILFLIELALNILARPDYFGSFFFWLDLIAAFSLLPDIPWIWNPMIGIHPTDSFCSPSNVACARRVSESYEYNVRWRGFLRLIRLVRIAKLFELFQKRGEEFARTRAQARAAAAAQHAPGAPKKPLDPASGSGEDDPDDMSITGRPSQVGQHLSEQTTRKVVLLVLAMLFGIPLLQPNVPEHQESSTIDELNAFAWDLNTTLIGYSGPIFQSSDPLTGAQVLTPEANETVYAFMLHEIDFDKDWYAGHPTGDTNWKPMLYLKVSSPYFNYEWQDPTIDDYRASEVKVAWSGDSIGVFSKRADMRQHGEYSFITTIVVLSLLTVGAFLFNRNNHRMVIVPIERMMATIVALQANPLAKASLSNLENNRDHNNETGMLERTLEKLTGLLQVGFGEAGSKMIQKCMNLNAEGDLDPLVDGTKMLAIFGFCDIRRFTDATECLKEDVMMYVNEIAAIVHTNVALCDGNPNKNIGDAFLLVWRLPGDHMDGDDLFNMNENQPVVIRPSLEVKRYRESLTNPADIKRAADEAELESNQSLWDRAKKAGASCPPIWRKIHPNLRQQVSILADKAIVSFLRIIVEIAGSDEIRRYANHPRLKAAFPDFEVTLGFGLHCGWAIEGPIGSRYKIDASYLSPHVNLSETLQDATKIYGTPLLISGEFYSLLSPYLKAHCRRLDVVKVSGRESPMNLYGFDINKQALQSIIFGCNPIGYDSKARIPVVELRGKNIILDELGIDRDVPGGPSAAPPPGQYVHELFKNIYLNAHESDFTRIPDYTGSERDTIQSSGPIASYHLVRSFRLAALQSGIPTVFFDLYSLGLDYYLAGDWPLAEIHFKKALQFYPLDQPTKVVMNVMKEYNFVAPPHWAGWHEV